MEFKGIRVLLLEGYARQSVPFAKAFRKLGCCVTVLCNSKGDLAYWSRFPNKKIIGICDPSKYEESSSFICNLIKNGCFDLVVPLVDFSAKVLSENKEELSKYAKIATNDIEVFKKSSDKLYVMSICQKNGIPCPKTLTNATSIDSIKDFNFSYPIVVKPRSGYGARGFHIFDSFEDTKKFFEREHLVSDYVIQECIPQTDSNMALSLFIDKRGNVKSTYEYCSRRWFPLKGGTGTLNELVDRPEDIAVCAKLAGILELKGLVGVDMIFDKRDGVSKVIEINPRSLACSKIGFCGNVNQAKLILENEFSENVNEQFVDNKKIGLCVRMSQIDFLWFLKSPNRWKSKPSWFRFWKTRDQLFSFTDPLPWFAFLFQGMKRYKNDERRKK